MATAGAPKPKKARTPKAGLAPSPPPPPPIGSDLLRGADKARARQHNATLDVAKTSAEADRRFELYLSTDPFPDVPPALLNGADIADYVAVTGMLEPFHPEKLKSASYEVALRGEYIIQDAASSLPRRGVLREETDTFVLTKNSIAFLTVEPYFRLPDYIALRHNLKIDHVYKGLLVGTGPLIDPGYVGRIALPLHNLTENDYEFRAGDGAIWVEFTKLSPRPEWTPAHQSRHARYITFSAENSRGKTVENYIGDATRLQPVPVSSSAQIATDAAAAIAVAAEAVATAAAARRASRPLSFIGVATLFGLGLALITVLMALIFEVADLKTQVGTLTQTISPTQAPVGPAPALTSTPSPTT